jgi:hypothetical protein
MAVQSNTFGGLRLSGDDAKKFRNQTRSRFSSPAAKSAAERGMATARALLAQGSAKVAK